MAEITAQISLRRMCLTKIAGLMWGNVNMRRYVFEWICSAPGQIGRLDSSRISGWNSSVNLLEELETEVNARISEFHLPKSLEDELTRFISATRDEILQWIYIHCVSNQDLNLIPREFCWDQDGTINYGRTADLILHEATPNNYYYDLVHRYCLEDYCVLLCNKRGKPDGVPMCLEKWFIEYGERAFSKNECFLDPQEFGVSYVNAFRCAALMGNRIAVEYFLGKVPADIKETLLWHIVGYLVLNHNPFECMPSKYAKTLYYLLNCLPQQSQEILLKHFPISILECFLEWPLQENFMQLFTRIHHYVRKSYKENLPVLKVLAKKISTKHDFDYRKLFEELWDIIPADQKYKIIDSCCRNDGHLICYLCEYQCWDCLCLIFISATEKQKKVMFSSSKFVKACKKCILDGKFNLLEYFAGTCISSNEELLEFRNNLKTNLLACGYEFRGFGMHQWKLFCKHLDDLKESLM